MRWRGLIVAHVSLMSFNNFGAWPHFLQIANSQSPAADVQTIAGAVAAGVQQALIQQQRNQGGVDSQQSVPDHAGR